MAIDNRAHLAPVSHIMEMDDPLAKLPAAQEPIPAAPVTGQETLTLAKCRELIEQFSGLRQEWFDGKVTNKSAFEANYRICRQANLVRMGHVQIVAEDGASVDDLAIDQIRANLANLAAQSRILEFAIDLTEREQLGGDCGSSVRRLNYQRSSRHPRRRPGQLF